MHCALSGQPQLNLAGLGSIDMVNCSVIYSAVKKISAPSWFLNFLHIYRSYMSQAKNEEIRKAANTFSQHCM